MLRSSASQAPTHAPGRERGGTNIRNKCCNGEKRRRDRKGNFKLYPLGARYLKPKPLALPVTLETPFRHSYIQYQLETTTPLHEAQLKKKGVRTTLSLR